MKKGLVMGDFSLSRRGALAGSVGLATAGLVGLPKRLAAQGAPIRIGELNSYSRMAAFSVPYRNAMQLAADQINAAGGVMGGRPLEFVFRDDGSTPGDAVRVADMMITR